MINYSEIWLVNKLICLIKKIVLLCSDMLDNVTKLVSIIKNGILCYLQCIIHRKHVKSDLKTYNTNQMFMLSYILLINMQGCIYFNLLNLSLHYPTASWRCPDAPETYWAALSQHAASTCCSSNLPRICFSHNTLWTFSFVWLHCEIFQQFIRSSIYFMAIVDDTLSVASPDYHINSGHTFPVWVILQSEGGKRRIGYQARNTEHITLLSLTLWIQRLYLMCYRKENSLAAGHLFSIQQEALCLSNRYLSRNQFLH